MSEEEELDIVRSLELTAEGSYDEGYAAGLAAANERVRELVEALKHFGWHRGKCPSNVDYIVRRDGEKWPPCDCGFAAILDKHGKE